MVEIEKQAWGASDLVKPDIGKVDVDEGFVYIRAMSAEYGLSLRGRDLQGAEIFEVIAESVCNPDGVTILTVEQVGKIPMKKLEQIVKGVFAFNKLGAKAVSEAVDELKKTDKTEDLIMTSSGHWEPTNQ